MSISTPNPNDVTIVAASGNAVETVSAAQKGTTYT
jgi:hypothetical protein